MATGLFSLRTGLLCVMCLMGATARAGIATPYVPASPGAVLQKVPSSTDPRVRAFETLRARLRAHPKNMKLALKLGRAYINYGRSTGDARFLGRGLAVIEPWLQQSPVPVPVAVVHATILQSRHFFAASQQELQSILKRDPGNVQAWLTLATVAMVQGDYKLANRSCVHLASVGGDFMGIACSASLRSLTGHAAQAYRLFSMIEHPGPKAPPAIKAWIQGLMADTAKRLGRAREADAHYREALQLTPGDNFLLADYADFLLDHSRAWNARNLVADYTQSDTSFMRLVFAEAALGSSRTQRDIQQMSARFAAMDQRHTHVYRREQARFVLYLKHDPPRALQLAEKNWTVQRAPKDMRVYLEAALAAGKPAAAEPVLKLLDKSHLQDPAVNRLARKVRTELPATSAVAANAEPAP